MTATPPTSSAGAVVTTRSVEQMSTQSPAADESDLRPPLQAWRAGAPGRGTLLCAAVLIVVQVLYRGWMSLGGWFFLDDFAFIGRAKSMPLWSRDYLLTAYNSHLMPGSYVLVRILNAGWPGNFTPVALTDTALQFIAGVLCYRLLVSLFGRRPVILAPLALYLFSAITLPAFLWWAAALNQLPLQIAVLGALVLHVGYLRTRRLWRGIAAAASVVGGLLFDEKTVLVMPVLAAMTVLYFTGGPPVRRLARAWAEHWKVWVLYLLVAGAYSGYYLADVPSPAKGNPGLSGLFQTATNMVGRAVVPAVFGGPWHWHRVGVDAAVADPPSVLLWASFVVAAAFVAASIAFWHRAVFGWFVVGAYLLADLALVSSSRGIVLGPLIGDEYRYSTDACLIIAVFATAAVVPLRAGLGTTTQRLIRRRSTARVLASLREDDDARELVRVAPGAVAVICGVLFTVGCLVSGAGYYAVWRVNPARTYIQNATREFDRLHTPITMIDEVLPNNVLLGLIYPYDRFATIFSRVRPTPRYLTNGDSTDALYTIDDKGHLRLSGVQGVQALPGPDGPCGWHVTDQPVSVPLQNTTYSWTWVLRVGYLASRSGTTTVSAGTTTARVHIEAGLHTLYVVVVGRIGSVQLGGMPDGGSLCTADVGVGNPVPMPGTSP